MKELLNIKVLPILNDSINEAAKNEAESLNHEAWTADAIRSTIALNGTYLAAYSGKEYVGHIGFTSVLDEGYITNIAVASSHRRKGIGARLLEEAIRVAKDKNLSFLSLEVRKSNLAAINLYKKFGFLEVGKRKNFYQNPNEDAIIMTKRFYDEA